MVRAFAIAIAVATVATAAAAQDTKRAPLAVYLEQSTAHLMKCRFQTITAMAQAGRDLTESERAAGDYRACIAQGRTALRSAYDAAAKAVKRPGAKAALKEHYIAAAGSLAGVAPSVGERQGAYDRRQGDADRRLQELWERFEVER